MKEEISYSELARRVGDCILNNTIKAELTSDDYEFELFNGEDTYCYKHESKDECQKHSDDCDYENVDVYQTYIITEDGAGYLKSNTNEIVYYNDKLDLYLWGVTHFGTSWDGVFTSIKSK